MDQELFRQSMKCPALELGAKSLTPLTPETSTPTTALDWIHAFGNWRDF